MVIFDLNNDGKNELIFRDTDSLKIYNVESGIPKRLFGISCFSFTGFEMPVYADIANSGQSKLCVQCAKSVNDFTGHLTVFGSPDSLPGWVPARGIWNQYNYNPLQINDDGTIPQFQPNQATYQGGRYNNFNVRASLLDSNGMYRAKAAGLYGEIKCVDYDITAQNYTVTFDLFNKADASLDVDTGLDVSFYDDNPETTGKLLGTYKTVNNINAGTDRKGLSYTINSPNLSKLFMVVNSSRSTSGVLVDSNFVVLECEYTDNVFQAVDLPRVETFTKEICTGESYDFYGRTIQTSGAFYHSHTGLNGCDSLLIRLDLSIINCSKLLCQNDTSLCYVNQKYPSFPFVIEEKLSIDSLSNSGMLMIDIDHDCIPEIVSNATEYNGSIANNIVFIDSKTGVKKSGFKTAHYFAYGSPKFVAADLDKDGLIELIVATMDYPNIENEVYKLICYELNGDIKWISDSLYVNNPNDFFYLKHPGGTPQVADFNQDGIAEIYINNKIFNGITGAMLLDGGYSGQGIGINQHGWALHSLSIAAQIDENPNDLELAAGYTIYDIKIINTYGITGNEIVPYNLLVDNKYTDGHTSIADFNNDGQLEVVTISQGNSNDQISPQICIYNLKNKEVKLLTNYKINKKLYKDDYMTNILIARLKKNGNLSITIGFQDSIFNFEFLENEIQKKWSYDVYSIWEPRHLAAFDFNNDGLMELVFQEVLKTTFFNIVNDNPKEVANIKCNTIVNGNNALIGNIMNSQSSMICLKCESDGFWIVNSFDRYKIQIFGSPDTLPGWTPARSIWNQYAYNPVQINDDGTVPQFQPNQATYQGGRYNNFNVQASLLDSNGMYRAKAAGLYGEIKCVDYDITAQNYTVTFDLYNKADASLDVDTGLDVSFYDDNPETTGKLLGTYKTINNINAGTDRKGLSYTINSPNLSKLFMVVNSSRSTSGALVDSNFVVLECDYSDNVYQTTDLPRIDQLSKEICTGETYDFYGTSVSTTGVFYHEISNAMGCDSIVARLNLAVKDVKNTQAAVMACDSASINGNTYLASDVLTFKTLTANGCDSIHTLNLTINASSSMTLSLTNCDTARWENQVFTQSGIYPYLRTNVRGCDSTITLDVVINNRASSSIDVSRCTGQTYDFYGQQLTNSGTYSHTLHTINGCDSIVTLRLLVSNNIQTNQNHQFCAGDSIRIGSAWVKSAGSVVENLLSTYGCDSIVTHRVDVLPLYSTTPNHMLCAGDSVRIRGAWIKTSGIRIENLSSINGCDSIITHNVFVRPAITSNISRQICAGDSIRFDNQWLKSSGTFTQTLAAANGCDSLLSMNLSILPTQQTQNTIMTCIGKPIKIHGIDRYTADTYSQTFTATNGCDSTSRVTLVITPYLMSSDLVRICAGDTTTINGTLITEAGQYIDTIVTANGCPEIVTTTVRLTAKSVASQVITLCPDTNIVINGQVIAKAGTYVFDLQSAAGCDSTLTTTVSQLAWPDPPKIEVDCEKEIYTATMNTIDPWLHRWSDGSTSSQYTINQGGKISVRAYTSIGCMRDYEYTLPLIPKLADIPKLNDKITKGTETVAVKVDVDPAQWQIKWQPSPLVDCDTCFIANISTLTDTTISVTLKHSSDCSFTQTFRILKDKVSTIDFPNIFRPTSSTGNATWDIKLPNGYTINEVNIYDRWGEKIAEGKNTNTFSWDGKFNGQLVQSGVYIYQVKLIDPTGNIVIKTGDVTVVF
jgi:gliding motility-associated-like protein